MMEAESIGVMDQPVSLLAVYFHLSASWKQQMLKTEDNISLALLMSHCCLFH